MRSVWARRRRPRQAHGLTPTRAAAVSTVLLAGCGGSPGSGSEDGSVTATAAFYPLAYVAERVAGDHAEVENLTTPGAEPHDLELSITQTSEVAEADLVVVLHGFQPAVDEAVAENAGGDVLEVADVVDLVPLEEHEGENGDGHEGEHEDADGHEHGDLDLHFWLDPLLMADLGDAVAERLSDADPDHAEAFAANAGALRTDLEALDQALTEGLSGCTRDVVVVSHDAFGYLSRYGLRLESIAGLSPESEPTASDLARLQDLIADTGVTTVFSETLTSPALAETLARDAGVVTGVLDPIEGLTDATAGEDYLSLMRANLAALQEVNEC